MKIYILIISFSLLLIDTHAQQKRPTKDQEALINDLLGAFNGETANKTTEKTETANSDKQKISIEIAKPKEDGGLKGDSKLAYISSDANENKIYRDNKGNEVTYSKEMWKKMLNHFDGDESVTLHWLIATYGRKSNVKEVHKINVLGQLEFSNKNKVKVTFGRNNLGILEYADNNGNKIIYSKEFADEILDDNGYNEINIFMWLVDRFQFIKSYQENYSINNLSTNFLYDNNQPAHAKLSTNTGIIMYEDSKGNQMTFDKQMWQKMVDRIGSDKKIFLSLISKYLFNNIPLQ